MLSIEEYLAKQCVINIHIKNTRYKPEPGLIHSQNSLCLFTEAIALYVLFNLSCTYLIPKIFVGNQEIGLFEPVGNTISKKMYAFYLLNQSKVQFGDSIYFSLQEGVKVKTQFDLVY